MSNEQVVDIFFEVLKMYDSSMYTQVDIAKKLNIPLKAVSFCTKHAGYWHTKAKQGVKGVYYVLEQYLETGMVDYSEINERVAHYKRGILA